MESTSQVIVPQDETKNQTPKHSYAIKDQKGFLWDRLQNWHYMFGEVRKMESENLGRKQEWQNHRIIE